MTDLLAVGEILIDLTYTGTNENGICQYAANPGGAPANVAVAAAKLGVSSGFAGKVGKDAFGGILRKTLKDCGVDESTLLESDEATTLAVVSVDATGERSFAFYRKHNADTLLNSEEVKGMLKDLPKILHFGSVSLVEEPERSATLDAVKIAKEGGAIISYDPNYRAALWQSEEKAVEEMKAPLLMVDILKISDEEIGLITGISDEVKAAEYLSSLGIKIVLITLGDKGTYYRMGEYAGHVPGYKVKVADTNGAGDTFLGAFISCLMREKEGKLNEISVDELARWVQFSNLAASLTCTKSGAIPAMPTLGEVLAKNS